MEYRITIAGPVALAPFVDTGFDGILRRSQLQITPQQLSTLDQTIFGCPKLDVGFNCTGGSTHTFPATLQTAGGTNWVPRMSAGLELQMFLPVVNAPFRIYWAYNPIRLDTSSSSPVPITRGMFPGPTCLPARACSAGDFTFLNAVNTFAPTFQLREPRKTFRFTVATTF
jgi:outer membrane protein insertion porin family